MKNQIKDQINEHIEFLNMLLEMKIKVSDNIFQIGERKFCLDNDENLGWYTRYDVYELIGEEWKRVGEIETLLKEYDRIVYEWINTKFLHKKNFFN